MEPKCNVVLQHLLQLGFSFGDFRLGGDFEGGNDIHLLLIQRIGATEGHHAKKLGNEAYTWIQFDIVNQDEVSCGPVPRYIPPQINVVQPAALRSITFSQHGIF